MQSEVDSRGARPACVSVLGLPLTLSGVALISSPKPGSFALGLSRTKAYSQSCRARCVQFSPVKVGRFIIAYFMIAGTDFCCEPIQDING